MIKSLARGLLSKVEQIAYLLAIWSFLVLFLEPIIAFYADFDRVENITALANIALLLLTIQNRPDTGRSIGSMDAWNSVCNSRDDRVPES